MANASEFRDNARVCNDLAAAARGDNERNCWLKMKAAWLKLAEKEESANAVASKP
jgi:hypothetical protein